MQTGKLGLKRVLSFSVYCLVMVFILGPEGVQGKDAYQRSVGIFCGSIALGGLRYENAINPQKTRSLTYLAGTMALHDVEIAQQLRYYMLEWELKPFGGVGLCEVLEAHDQGLNLLVNITGAVGLDWRLLEKYHGGAEFMLHYVVFNFPLTGVGLATSANFITRQLVGRVGLYVGREF